MQQAAWVPNATGNTATPTVTSCLIPVVAASIPLSLQPYPQEQENGKETGNMGRGKHVARTKPSKTKTKIKTKQNNGKHTGSGSVSLSCPPEEMRQTIRNKLSKQNKYTKIESTAKDTLSIHEGKNNDYFTKKKRKG